MLNTAVAAIANGAIIELDRIGEQKSCIFAGAVLVEAFKRAGIPGVVALTVNVLIFNPTLTNRLGPAGMLPMDENVIDQWDKEGCKMIKIGDHGGPPRPNEWPGHLVVIVPNQFGDQTVMCDLTLPQANKLDWGVELMPSVTKVPAKFVIAEQVALVIKNGCRVVYKAFPDDRSFESSPAWTHIKLRDGVVDRILDAL